VIWTRNGTVATVHQYADSNDVPHWSVLVFIYQTNDMGFLTDTEYIALNGAGTPGHGNFCWNNGNNGCLSSPMNLGPNQTLTVDALNDGNFMISNHQM
jgi:hypothetical protein